MKCEGNLSRGWYRSNGKRTSTPINSRKLCFQAFHRQLHFHVSLSPLHIRYFRIAGLIGVKMNGIKERFICPLIKSFDEDRKRLLQSNILICIHDCYFDTYIQIDGTIEIYHGFIVHFVFLCLFRFFSVNSIIFKLKIFNFSVKEIVMIYSLFAW